MEDPSDDRPWTEEQWEKMMKESDVRSARFGELLETLHDHPDRHDLIDKEMGWDHEDEQEEASEEQTPEEGEDASPEDEESFADEFLADADSEEDEEAIPSRERRRDALKQIAAYATCERVGELVRVAMEPYQQNDHPDERVNELLGEAWIGIHIACAKIAGGHAMGYDDETLCGNIVNNKRALDGARQSMTAFEELRGMKIIPEDEIDRLLPELQTAVAAIEARIAELRSRVWWDKKE